MIKLLQFLMWGCWHKWETLDECNLEGQTTAGTRGKIGVVFICRCTKCGEPKRFTLD